MSTSHIYNLGGNVTQTLNLLALFYSSTRCVLNIVRKYVTDIETYTERSETSVAANRLLQAYRCIVMDDKRVVEIYISILNVPCITAFTAAMPIINKDIIMDMIDESQIIDATTLFALRDDVRNREYREENLNLLYQHKIPDDSLLTYFGHICLFEASIVRAYYVQLTHRIVFEMDGNLMSLSSKGLIDQAAISFDLMVGFQKTDPYSTSTRDKDLVEQCMVDFDDWIEGGNLLDELPLKWHAIGAPHPDPDLDSLYSDQKR